MGKAYGSAVMIEADQGPSLKTRPALKHSLISAPTVISLLAASHYTIEGDPVQGFRSWGIDSTRTESSVSENYHKVGCL
jgi:hypothetical protein